MNEGVRSCGRPSRGRYNGGCRCWACTLANAAYEYERQHRAPRDRSTPMVGEQATRRARARVTGWLADGHSLREVCRATGVPRSSMRTLLYGKHHHAPVKPNGEPMVSKRLKRSSYDAIMRCDMDKRRIADGSYVDAKPVVDAIEWLVAHGVKRARIAREAGIPSATIYQLGKRDTVRFGTIRKIAPAAMRLKDEVERRTA